MFMQMKIMVFLQKMHHDFVFIWQLQILAMALLISRCLVISMGLQKYT